MKEIRMCETCQTNPSQHQNGQCDPCYQAEMERKIQEMLAAAQAKKEEAK